MGAVPDDRKIWYQKHMTQHVPAGADLSWAKVCVNAFLIRDPAEVAASYARTRPNVSLEDLGFSQQWEIFCLVTERWKQPAIVLDARDVLQSPGHAMRHLCTACGIPFKESMLSWRPGPRATDGVWAKHWYAAVEASTGFHPYEPRTPRLSPRLREVVAQAQQIYDALYARRLPVQP